MHDLVQEGLALLALLLVLGWYLSYSAARLDRLHHRVETTRAALDAQLARRAAAAVELLGPLGDEEKAALLRSADVYVAPHTGGESFGIVLVEAMSAGAPVVASDLGAFRRVLDDGALGVLFPPGEPQALAAALTGLLADADRRARLSASAARAVRRYDWGRVAGEVLAVYETVRLGADRVVEDLGSRRLLTRWRG